MDHFSIIIWLNFHLTNTGDKYVASVESKFTDTTVYFYKYVNSFVMSSEAEFEEYYNGCYDPIKMEEENAIRTKEGTIIANR